MKTSKVTRYNLTIPVEIENILNSSGRSCSQLALQSSIQALEPGDHDVLSNWIDSELYSLETSNRAINASLVSQCLALTVELDKSGFL